jgi:hypothetical protein
MQLVYATGQRERDFRIAAAGEELPAGARVYATCTKEATAEDVGEVTFQTMTDEEFYALKAQVREARERAAREPRAAAGGLFGRLFGR